MKQLQVFTPARMATAIISATLCSIAISAPGQLISYEGFGYPDGSQLFGSNGGAGWATPWSAAGTSIATNVSGGLNYGVLPTSGGGLVMGHSTGWPATGGQTANAQRLLPETLGNLAVSGTVWLSFLYQNWNTDQAGLAGFREAKLMFFSGATTNANGNANVNGSERLNVGTPNTYAAGASDTLSLWQGSTFVSSGLLTPRGADPANTVYVLLRLDVDNTTAADTAYAWFNPNLLSEPSTASAISFNLQDLSGVNAIRLQAGNNNASGTNAVFMADEIRVGLTWADMVGPIPEPSSVALVGLASAAILIFRRRR